MGLTGETVEQNVVNQQAIGRDERAKEIQLELIEYKAEKCKLDVERETVKLEHELARLNSKLFNKVDTYAVRLGSLLTGKAADIYTSLSPEVTSEYGSLKKIALLKRSCKTPNSYRATSDSRK